MICPRCQNEIDDDMNYCPHCGMKIEKCPVCHQIVVPAAKFCSHCGASLHTNYQKSQLEGYYEPLGEMSKSKEDKQVFNQEENISFQEIPMSKKVNKKVIIIAVSILVVLTVISGIYLKFGPGIPSSNQKDAPTKELPKTEMVIQGQTSFSTHIGNINMNGGVYQSEEKIYMLNDQGAIVSMNKQLQSQQIIVNEKCQYINVLNNVIYYTNAKNQLCSISTEGKDQKVLIDQAVYYVVVKEDKIYYQLDGNGTEYLYVYDLKTQKSTQLNERNSYCINVVDDKIYFTSSDGIYSIGIDGKGEEKLLSETTSNLIYQDGLLYFGTSQLMSYNVTSRETKTIVDSIYNFLNLTDQYLFYQDSKGLIMKYDLKTQKISKVYSGKFQTVYVVGDKIVVEATTGYANQYKVIMDFDGQVQQRLFAGSQGNYI